MSKYLDIGDDWEDVPKTMELACCDCLLVHSIQFRVFMGEKPRLQWKVDRNNRATAALRRKKGKRART